MKRSIPSLLCLLALSMASLPSIGRADYQPPEIALQKLENIVTLSAVQKAQAFRVYQNLKEVMDDIPPAERPAKGAQARRDAVAAIRAILTPEQQTVFDRTPLGQGGGARNDPETQALNLKIRSFVTDWARTSQEITSQMGTVKKVIFLSTGSSKYSNGNSPDPAMHPDGGSNTVSVTGTSATKTYVILWAMDASGEMKVTEVHAKEQ